MSTVIKVENLSKQYRLGDVGTGSIAHDVNRAWHKVRGKEDPYLKIGESNDRTKKGESDYVWAIKDINFEVKQGEVLGIIGRNGAGKSTLLKILSRTTTPTTGSVKIKGRVASLLEVGTGFHPELSGRENIFLNGAIMGMTKQEIKRKFDEIVDFAGVERYIDTPVKRYSSGMYVRLAFGVAAHLEPEILIVDEVLAVGDAEFQKKAMGKMKDVSEKEGRTVLFVSHNMQAISYLCNNCIVMNLGGVSYQGEVKVGLNKYSESLKVNNTSNQWKRITNDKNSLSFSTIKSHLFEELGIIKIKFIINFTALDKFKACFIAIDISTIHVPLMQAIPTLVPIINADNFQNTFEIIIELPSLVPDIYYADFWIGSHNTETMDFVEKAIMFEIIESPTLGRTVPHTADHGFIVPHSIIKTIS